MGSTDADAVDTLLALTSDLVAIPSHEDPTRAGDRLEAWLREETDARVERDEVGNVIARRGSGETLALVGHHDVVAPADGQLEPDGTCTVEHRNGRLYGRGTADMKGALAAMALAFRDADPPGELAFASFVGEETGGEGCRHALEEGFAPPYAIVGEGSTDYSAADVSDVVVAHKGRRGSTIIAEGRAAHASEPERGENAIYRACEAVEHLRDLAPPTAPVPTADATMQGSVVVTEIEGGDAWNVIPDRCTVTVDERTVPGERVDASAVADATGVDWRVDQDLPPMACGDEAFVAAALTAADDAQEGTPRPVTKHHATDAGWLADTGVSCLILGPAEPGEAHTDTESVSVAALDRCRRIYAAIASNWPSG